MNKRHLLGFSMPGAPALVEAVAIDCTHDSGADDDRAGLRQLLREQVVGGRLQRYHVPHKVESGLAIHHAAKSSLEYWITAPGGFVDGEGNGACASARRRGINIRSTG
jgi:hypothetical protein